MYHARRASHIVSLQRILRDTSGCCRVILTLSASRATAPERKARRRRQHPVADWKAKGDGGHDDQAAMLGWGRGSTGNREVVPVEMDRGPPASSRCRDVRMSAVASRGSRSCRPGVHFGGSLRRSLQVQAWRWPFVCLAQVVGAVSGRAQPGTGLGACREDLARTDVSPGGFVMLTSSRLDVFEEHVWHVG